MAKRKINFYNSLHGFHWQFPGGAENSYSYVVRKIQNDPRLSQKRKDELIEDVTYLVGHVLSDADFMIRNRYGSASSSGIKYLKFDLFDRPAKWVEKLFYGDLKSVYATSTLESLSLLQHIRNRVFKTAERLDNEFNKETES